MKRRAQNPWLMIIAAVALFGACSSSNSGATTDAGATACGDAACAASQICVRTLTAGGAQLCPQDGGTCPDGYVLSTNGCCSAVPVYGCGARPSGCGASITCACASSLCAPSHTCSAPGGNEIDCTLLAP